MADAGKRSELFGFFDSPDQTTPAFDPGLNVACPFCLRPLELPVKTISLILPGDDRSFFYRSHKSCYETASEKAIGEIEGSLIDTRALTTPTQTSPASEGGK